VDKDRLAYVGISWGAITGVTYAAHDPRIRVVASLVGGGNFLGWLPGDIDPAVQQYVQRFDPVFHVALIDPRPLLLLNVTRDILVPQFLSESLHKAAGPSAKKVWLDTDHIFSTVDRAALAEQVIDFVQEKLPQSK
jgi:pimeloyl-ACP methyl ester carboxylesterase